MKKLLAGLAAVVALAAAGASLVRYLSPDQVARRAIEHTAGLALQTTVRVDRVQISAADGTGFITGFSVGNPAGFVAPTAFTAHSIRITLDPASLDKETIVIRTLSVATPRLTYEVGTAGSNLAKLLENIRLDTNKRDAPGKKLRVERVVLHEAKVGYASPKNAGQMITVDLPDDIRVSNAGQPAEGTTSREFAAGIAEALIYHVNRKVPADAPRSGPASSMAPVAPAGK